MVVMPTRGVVEEKESRARETMCVMGLQPWALNAAWAATYAAILTTVSLTVAVVCKASFLPNTSFRSALPPNEVHRIIVFKAQTRMIRALYVLVS